MGKAEGTDRAPSGRVPLSDDIQLTEAELRDVESRIRAARRLARKIGLPEGSELGRLVAEVRYGRARDAQWREALAQAGICLGEHGIAVPGGGVRRKDGALLLGLLSGKAAEPTSPDSPPADPLEKP